jgi:hypothetical protein
MKPIAFEFDAPAGMVQATVVYRREIPWHRCVAFGIDLEILSESNEIRRRNVVVSIGEYQLLECRSDRDVEALLRRECPHRIIDLLAEAAEVAK